MDASPDKQREPRCAIQSSSGLNSMTWGGKSGGPQAALQNMVMLGLFSYVVDTMQTQPAEASSRQTRKVGSPAAAVSWAFLACDPALRRLWMSALKHC